MSYEHEWNPAENHRLAAEQLANKLDWLGTVNDGEGIAERVLLQGSAPDPWGYMFVITNVKRDSREATQIEFNQTATENLEPVESPAIS